MQMDTTGDMLCGCMAPGTTLGLAMISCCRPDLSKEGLIRATLWMQNRYSQDRNTHGEAVYDQEACDPRVLRDPEARTDFARSQGTDMCLK